MMGNGATLPKIAVTPAAASTLRHRSDTLPHPKSGSAVATATVTADVAQLESDETRKAVADWVIHSSTQRLADNEDNNNNNHNGRNNNNNRRNHGNDDDVGMINLGHEDDEGPPGMMSTSYSRSFTMEQTVDGGGRGTAGKSMSYRIKTPEDGSVKITTPDGAVKMAADGRNNTLGRVVANGGPGEVALPRDALALNGGSLPTMLPDNDNNIKFSSQQTTSFSYEYMMDKN